MRLPALELRAKDHESAKVAAGRHQPMAHEPPETNRPGELAVAAAGSVPNLAKEEHPLPMNMPPQNSLRAADLDRDRQRAKSELPLDLKRVKDAVEEGGEEDAARPHSQREQVLGVVHLEAKVALLLIVSVLVVEKVATSRVAGADVVDVAGVAEVVSHSRRATPSD